jgi:hypothetical protein
MIGLIRFIFQFGLGMAVGAALALILVDYLI